MKYLVLKIQDGTENSVKNYAEFVLETAEKDQAFTGVPSPFIDEFFIGTLSELNESRDSA